MIGSIAIGLLGLLTLSIPVGIVLFLLGFGIDAFYSPFPLDQRVGQSGLVDLKQRDTDRHSVLCHAGRNPCPLWHRDPHLCST